MAPPRKTIPSEVLDNPISALIGVGLGSSNVDARWAATQLLDAVTSDPPKDFFEALGIDRGKLETANRRRRNDAVRELAQALWCGTVRATAKCVRKVWQAGKLPDDLSELKRASAERALETLTKKAPKALSEKMISNIIS